MIGPVMIRALVLAVVGAASFAGVYLVMTPDEPASVEDAAVPTDTSPLIEIAPAGSAVQDATDAASLELRPGAEALPQSSEPTRVVRDVTPDNMTAGPKVIGTLARIAPAAQPADAPQERSERLYNAIVLSAGVIKVREREIHLAGVTAPDFKERCGEGVAAWPCGRMARAALQRFIRGRAIDCQVPAGADQLPDPADCMVGGENMSEWLIAQGWAKRSGQNFEDAEKIAREAKLGLWSEGRPDQASEVAATSG